ncbi:translocation protein SEC62 [Cylas formicarius]|uniref:translocation protein SEC62 n=1 Tax=Cylas formicarius TaxID=197179 RepID=UPI0029586C79|nr:translocation protein SEC62 [Cylas formicarius]
MAEKKRGKKRKEEYMLPGQELGNKPTKEEFNIAKWMRKNVPIKKTKFLNHNVEYFTGKRAVDALMESNYAKGETPLFRSRNEVVDYLHVMLEHKFYHRAIKVPVSEQELRGKKKDKKKESESSDEKKISKEKEQNKGTDAESSVVESKDVGSQSEKEKRKKKIRLEMHNDQHFVDNLDAYVWIYDPIPFYYWIIGTLLVLGAIGVCLFPLWPPSVRLGVYYLSVAAACFLVSMIAMAIIRLIIFCLIWAVTLGRHHLWILPNLTEDVGFFASFWPIYTYEYRDPGSQSALDKKKKKKKKKDKDSDAEEEADVKEQLTGGDKLLKERDEEDKRNVEVDPDGQQENAGGSESESESKSSTGKDFEIVDGNDLEES